jgi:hypothetical protein
VTSSMRSMRKPNLASALMAAWAPGPGVLGPAPPGARTFMWTAVIPLSRAISAAVDARMAAYGEDSMRSALTNIPPVVRAIVSAPEMSVMWIKVLL